MDLPSLLQCCVCHTWENYRWIINNNCSKKNPQPKKSMATSKKQGQSSAWKTQSSGQIIIFQLCFTNSHFPEIAGVSFPLQFTTIWGLLKNSCFRSARTPTFVSLHPPPGLQVLPQLPPPQLPVLHRREGRFGTKLMMVNLGWQGVPWFWDMIFRRPVILMCFCNFCKHRWVVTSHLIHLIVKT